MKDGDKSETIRMPGLRLLMVVSPYYRAVAANLVKGAMAAGRDAGAKLDTVEVPGAFEIPAAIVHASYGHQFDGYVALGCVIRGETSHYDHICTETARALMDLTIRDRFMIGNGILTVNTLAQAQVRADPERGDKGGEATRACIAMVAVRRRFKGAMG